MSHALESELERLLAEPLSSVMERERLALDRLLKDVGGRVVLFGAGGLGKQAVACLRSIGVEPLAMSDNDPQLWDTAIDEVRVLPPTVAAALFGTTAVFVVTIWNPFHWYSETRRQLEALGCNRLAPPAAIYWHFATTLLPYYAQDLPRRMSAQVADILHASRLWEDDRSRQEYMRQVRWRFLGETEFTRCEAEESYFPADLLTLQANEVFVDCGAYDGDTIRSMLSRCRGAFRHILAIEPDLQTFTILESYVKTLPREVRDKIRLVRCAAGATRSSAPSERIGGPARPPGSADPPLFCRPIAELLDGSLNATYIKMDIEGAEHDALQGARAVIERDRPVLAICVYHKPGDLWRLPLFMSEMVSDYRMYLRSYEGDGWQTVAYAIPPERCVPGVGR